MHPEHWEIIGLLWLPSVVLAMIAAIRLIRARPLISKREERFLFPADAETRITPWFWIKLAALALILFCIGINLGLVVVNIGSPWARLAPVATALATILLLVWWLRSAPRTNLSRKANRRREDKHPVADRMDAFEL